MRDIYFAGGCFWGVEEFFSRVPGVLDVTSGYANGMTSNPNYSQVCRGRTGYAEAVHVRYDPHRVLLKDLVKLFFEVIDPTSVNRQGNDEGTQYRTGIYYVNPDDLAVICEVASEVQARWAKPIVVDIEPLRVYFMAEEEHQNYLKKHPGGYCHINFEILKDFKLEKPNEIESKKYVKPSLEELKKRLSFTEFNVTQNGGTELAYSGQFWNNKAKGLYVDIVTGEPLFSSNDQFDGGCGWPSFSRPIKPEVIQTHEDHSHWMQRTEVRSQIGQSHLGHVFDDGPKSTGGLRYCINSAALRFIPVDKMKEEGYADWLPFVKSSH